MERWCWCVVHLLWGYGGNSVCMSNRIEAPRTSDLFTCKTQNDTMPCNAMRGPKGGNVFVWTKMPRLMRLAHRLHQLCSYCTIIQDWRAFEEITKIYWYTELDWNLPCIMSFLIVNTSIRRQVHLGADCVGIRQPSEAIVVWCTTGIFPYVCDATSNHLSDWSSPRSKKGWSIWSQGGMNRKSSVTGPIPMSLHHYWQYHRFLGHQAILAVEMQK